MKSVHCYFAFIWAVFLTRAFSRVVILCSSLYVFPLRILTLTCYFEILSAVLHTVCSSICDNTTISTLLLFRHTPHSWILLHLILSTVWLVLLWTCFMLHSVLVRRMFITLIQIRLYLFNYVVNVLYFFVFFIYLL